MRSFRFAASALGLCLWLPQASAQTFNQQIAFVENGIKIMKADGTNVKTVYALKSGESVGRPVWSPDGAKLAFPAKIVGVQGVYTIDLNGKNRKLVATPENAWSYPNLVVIDWSSTPAPDGQYKIAFEANVKNRSAPTFLKVPDIFIVNPNGTGLVNITYTETANGPGHQEIRPVFTRTGELMFYSSRSATNADLDVITLGLDDFGNVVPVSRRTEILGTEIPGGHAIWPRWANQSDVFVYYSAGAPRLLWECDLSGLSPVFWAFPPAPPSMEDSHPCYSPDNSKILFNRADFVGTADGIYVMNWNGSGIQRIRSTGIFAAWKRAPPGGP